jgi:hypothetical protein
MINPNTTPKQVDSVADGGPNAGQVSHGIYEIPDLIHQRACFGPPGGPRPTEFKSSPGSGRILQYWKKIGPRATALSRELQIFWWGLSNIESDARTRKHSKAGAKPNRHLRGFARSAFGVRTRPRIAFAKCAELFGTPH